MKQSKKIALVILSLLALSGAVHAAPWELSTIWAPGFCATAQPRGAFCQSAKATADHLLSLQLVSPQGRCQEARHMSAAAAFNKAQDAYLAINGKADWEELWKQYGVCSGLTAEGYLSTHADMAKMIGQTSLGKLLQESRGQLVAKEKLLNALRYDYFVGADRKANLVCRQGYLIGVVFYPREWSELFVKTEQGGMLDVAPAKASPPPESECPAQVQL